jgi:prepilin-type processing-associated H-X9-DG protein
MVEVRLKKSPTLREKRFQLDKASPLDGNSAAWASNDNWATTGIGISFDWEHFAACVPAHDRWDMRDFRSSRPGGVQFAFADGSVRFIPDNIDHPIYRAFSARKNGSSGQSFVSA